MSRNWIHKRAAGRKPPQFSEACGKLVYTSREHARNRARHNRASFRVSVYWCSGCRGWHTTNPEKR